MAISDITTVITTTGLRYIKHCLPKVLRQHKRVVVVCDRLDVDVKKYCKRQKVKVLLFNRIGQAQCRLRGLQLVQTKYTHLLDDDDYICDGFFPDVQDTDIYFGWNTYLLTDSQYVHTSDCHFNSNFSCHIVKTSLLRIVLNICKDYSNFMEDLMYHLYMAHCSVELHSGAVMRLMNRRGASHNTHTNVAMAKAYFEMAYLRYEPDDLNYRYFLHRILKQMRTHECMFFNALH